MCVCLALGGGFSGATGSIRGTLNVVVSKTGCTLNLNLKFVMGRETKNVQLVMERKIEFIIMKRMRKRVMEEMFQWP